MHSQRKLDHLRICLEEDVAFDGLSTGLEQFQLIHQALPELALDDVDTTTTFLGRRLSAPLLISAMTGGTESAEMVNRNLAVAAQKMGIAMCVGSQRAALVDPGLARTYRVRDVAPDILLFANLGAVQLNYEYGLDECIRAVEMIEADGLVLHLNPLQESLQTNGNTNFRDLLKKIQFVCTHLPVPVVVKEVGWGLSGQAARLLVQAGVSALDVAGAGGTCWALVEKMRAGDESLRRVAESFIDWGISTADSILMVKQEVPTIPIVASGGIRTGIEVVKSICLGAGIGGMAIPFLKLATVSSEQVIDRLKEIILEMRIAMFCTSARTIAGLDRSYFLTLPSGTVPRIQRRG
jgi:isopentenyl-diphosphate Delta-isomerase